MGDMSHHAEIDSHRLSHLETIVLPELEELLRLVVDGDVPAARRALRIVQDELVRSA